ncbi:MAG: hypothetical protein WC291_07265 [Thermodesulfovibrionales bacterium]|jgi:transcriptional regulator with XRE-family HTH domain
MKRKNVTIPNLQDLTYAQTLELARALSGKTYMEIAEALGKGPETIRRYFTDPSYNPPSHLIPELCKVLGNFLIIEWQCLQAGGYFIREDLQIQAQNIELLLAELTKEFADVLKADGDIKIISSSREYNRQGLSVIEKEIHELIIKAGQIHDVIELMKVSAQ